MKQALGISLSGTEIHAALLIVDKGRIRIKNLERIRLKTLVGFERSQSEGELSTIIEPGEELDFESALEAPEKTEKSARTADENLEAVFHLLRKYTNQKIRVGLNMPISTVNYQRQIGPVVLDKSGLEPAFKIDQDGENTVDLGHETVTGTDGATINIAYEKHPPLLALLQQVNGYLANNLRITLMDTTEFALVNLARQSQALPPGGMSAIVYVEEDESKVVFLEGGEIFHISSIIHETIKSPSFLSVLSRKLQYEQDEAQINQLDAILLAGKCHEIDAREQLAQAFAESRVSYLSTAKLGEFPSTEEEHKLFSEFSVAISLAWKLLRPKDAAFIQGNLLPAELKAEHEILKLNAYGYTLLVVTGLVAFFFTWQILKARSDIISIRLENNKLKEQIENNKPIVDKVLDYENETKRIKKNLSLSDSLSTGYDEFLGFLHQLNTSVRQTGGLWINEISRRETGFSVKGMATNRNKIPILAEKLEQANLKKVTRATERSQKLFTFELERYRSPDNFQFSENGIRMIDAGNYAFKNGLVLSTKAEESSKGAFSPRPPVRNARGLVTNKNRSSTQPATGRVASTRSRNGTTKRKRKAASHRDTRLAGKNADLSAGNTVRSSSSRRSRKSKTGSPHNSIRITPGARTLQDNRTVEPDDTSSRKRSLEGATAQPARYTIELAADLSKSSAEKAAAKYRRLGLNVLVQSYLDARSLKRRYRVISGEYRSWDKARAKSSAFAALLNKFYDVVPVSLYLIEAAIVRERNTAEKITRGYRKLKATAEIEAITSAKQDKRYRVLVGPFLTRDEAAGEAQRIKAYLSKDYRPVTLRRYSVEAASGISRAEAEKLARNYRHTTNFIKIAPEAGTPGAFRLLVGCYEKKYSASEKAKELAALLGRKHRIVKLELNG